MKKNLYLMPWAPFFLAVSKSFCTKPPKAKLGPGNKLASFEKFSQPNAGFLFSTFLLFSNILSANPNIDQWLESEKSYKDLINEGFEVKSYAISDIEVGNGLTIILFVTVLQKNQEIYECQEYQTIDENVETLDMNLICKQLVQPYQRGIGT